MAASHLSETVTLLFTDIEGSTRRWEHLPEQMAVALARHDAIMREAIAAHGGTVFKTIGDAFCAVFRAPADGLRAALAAQRALAAEDWGEVGHVRVRMALHTGSVQHRDADYFGPQVNRVARLLATGYGEQILVSRATKEVLEAGMPAGVALRDLGEHRLKDLLHAERIFQVTAPDLPAEFPPIKALDRLRHNLPEQPTALIGRDADLAAIRALIEHEGARVVTLTGPGGVGKTRLGLQTAADLVDGYPDGAWFVGLAPLRDPALVLPAIGSVLGVREEGGQALADRLRDELRDKHLLLLLDNFEHVAPAAGEIGRLMANAPGLTLLVTSRSPLRVYGERDYAVAPLALPDPRRLPPLDLLQEVESVRLFVDRAQAVRRDFALAETNAAAIAGICARLDGLPLAIELAAARVKLFPPATLLSRLDSRLQVLTGGAVDRDPRQQTLRGAIAWSYDLLDPGEQTLFRRLAVFSGGCTFEVAEAVVGGKAEAGGRESDGSAPAVRLPPASSVLDGLASLIDKSLLRQEETDQGEPRFFMLETLREFGLEQLRASGEESAVRRRHAETFAAMFAELERELTGEEQGIALDRIEHEIDNLRGAIAWLTDAGEAERVISLGSSLRILASRRGYRSEVRQWLERAIQGYRGDSIAPRAHGLTELGNLANLLGDYAGARANYEQAHALWTSAGNTLNMAISSYGLGTLARSQVDFGAARAYFQEALDEFRTAGDTQAVAFTLDQLGELARLEGDHAEAHRLHGEALNLVETLGDPDGLAYSFHALGRLALDAGNETDAERYLTDSLALYESSGDRWGVATALHGLGLLAVHRSRWTEASAFFVRSLEIWQELEDRMGLVECLEGLALADHVHPEQSNLERSVRLLACASEQREKLSVPAAPPDRGRHERTLSALRGRIDEPSFSAAWSAGSTLTLDDAVADVLRTPG